MVSLIEKRYTVRERRACIKMIQATPKKIIQAIHENLYKIFVGTKRAYINTCTTAGTALV